MMKEKQILNMTSHQTRELTQIASYMKELKLLNFYNTGDEFGGNSFL